MTLLDSYVISLAVFNFIPIEIFFNLIGTLLLTLEHSVDLINLDKQESFSKILQDHEELVRVA